MPTNTISYAKTGYFSKLISDYLDEAGSLAAFYNRPPVLSEFGKQLEEKRAVFSNDFRNRLVESLKRQNSSLKLSEASVNNINSLSESNSFTVTTGHQLNLFTGPLYFLYKIISVINLSEVLKNEFPEEHFVPVYWMATEDHDFEEINYFNFRGKKLSWNRDASGAVGRLSTEGLSAVLENFKAQLDPGSNSKELERLFKEAYLEHHNLTDATRFLANELFGEYGLVIIDGDDAELKKAFVPYALKDLETRQSFEAITSTTEKLKGRDYPEQVHPREINLFYIKDGLRERIIEKDSVYYINETDIKFNFEELKAEVSTHPERFSPNALLRPLYQEVILPNLCYTGGGGELAYWFQLKDYFEAVDVTFPILILRNSALLVSEKLREKLDKLSVTVEELFQKQHQLKNAYTRRISDITIDFSVQREHLKKQFSDLYDIAARTDASFVGAVAAQEKKQLNGLDKLEKRLLKAQRKRYEESLTRLTAIQDELFPEGHLQERMSNFSEFYMLYGRDLFTRLKEELHPFSREFTIITI